MVDWYIKLAALLHDPADKPFEIPGHEARAESGFVAATGRQMNQTEKENAKAADILASAADRINFPPSILVDFRKSPIITHPLSGRRKLDLITLQSISISEAPRRAIEKLCTGESDPFRKYLRLWRRMNDVLAEESPDIGALWRLLPADTRMPDHPLPQHLSVSSALAGAGEYPALLVFSIGPVQDFIAAARRTQDLWAGSYLLAYLTWAGIKAVISQFGPDSILFPSLYGQPLVDDWLSEQGAVAAPDRDQLSIATLPNKFTAILPTGDAIRAAKQAEDAVRQEWQHVAARVCDFLRELSPTTPTWQAIWDQQVASWPEVYWSVFEWPDSPEEATKVYDRFIGIPEDFRKAYELFVKKGSEGGGQYNPNLGTVYQLLYHLVERSFASRKGLRNFLQSDEGGEQCTVVPGYKALHIGDATLKGVRRYWTDISEVLSSKGDRAVIKPKGAERLSAIGAVKRFAGQVFFKPELDLDERFPSITSLTMFPFYEALSIRLPNRELEKAIDALTIGLFAANVPPTVNYNSLPNYIRSKVGALGAYGRLLKDLMKFDGEWLLKETYDQQDFEPGIEKATMPALSKSLSHLLKVAKDSNIDAPSRYYAILTMDGDRMGQWLNGTHASLPAFSALLHSDTEMQLKSMPGWNELLSQKRLISPAYHAAVSQALGNFAMHCVRRVVEELHPGVLVYAGGDDVLAILPLEHALSAARELRALFSGQAVLDNLGAREIDFISDQHTGYMAVDNQPLMTMGPTATASVGIAIAHHSASLSGVLAAAHTAEKSAKNLYGRNALAVKVLKRSGEVLNIGSRWYYPDAVPDTVSLLQDFLEALQKGDISTRFAHAFYSEAPTLSNLPREALLLELRRLLKRHKGEEITGIQADQFAEKWSNRLTNFALSLDEHRSQIQKKQGPLSEEGEIPQAGALELGKWLLLANFLNRGGQE